MALRDSDPSEVGGYHIEDRLGAGGMGVVYLARSDSGSRLAVKAVHGQYADDDEFRARFRREVSAARQVGGRAAPSTSRCPAAASARSRRRPDVRPGRPTPPSSSPARP